MKIDELRELVAGWQDGASSSVLERDMALERVKKIYEMLRFPEAELEAETVEPEVEVVELEVEPEPIVVEAVAEYVEEPTQPESEKQERLRKIMSLYDDDLPEEPVVEELEEAIEEIVEEIVVEAVVEAVVEEIIEEAVEAVVEEAIEDLPEPNPNLPTIAELLGFNDMLVMSNDLFGGDMSALKESLARIEREPTLDDAIFYIAQNYSWSGDSEGAKLLFVTLQSRYL